MILMFLAACDRSRSPDSESAETTHRSEADLEGEVLQVSRSGRPTLVFRRYFRDADSDGFGAPGSGLLANRRPEGYARLAGDCNDTDATVNPSATEVEADGVDNDCDGDTDESTDTGTESGADTGSGTDTADSSSGTDTATSDTGMTSDTAGSDTGDSGADTAVTSTGIVVSRDTTDSLTYPATIYAWYGPGPTTSTATVASASDSLVFSPTDAELSSHSWVDIQASWDSDVSWSDDCSGFTATSSDYTVALYENTTSTSTADTCRIYVGLAVPSGGDAGVWTAVP